MVIKVLFVFQHRISTTENLSKQPHTLVNKSSLREFRPPIKAITSRDVDDVIDGDLGRISNVKFL
jgi:hypothetical protein